MGLLLSVKATHANMLLANVRMPGSDDNCTVMYIDLYRINRTVKTFKYYLL